MNPFLTIEDLSVTFSVQGKPLHAVRGVSFTMQKGESVGIVGESGCGKSATVQAIAGLSTGKVTGTILLEGKERLQPGRDIGIVFQDPMTSLNPTMKIGAQITEGLLYHKLARRREAQQKALELLHLVGLSEPALRMEQYPHQLSGGMRQRVLIAIALICHPRLLIADESTTALDAHTRHQILSLLKQMQEHFQLSLLVISHDLKVVAEICQQVLIFYAGKIIERGPVQEVLHHPKHPYTQMLLNSLPRPDQSRQEPLQSIEGSPPNLLTLPQGCAFRNRCPYAALKCQEEPQGPIACWRAL